MKDTSWVIPSILSILILGGIVAFVIKGGTGTVQAPSTTSSETALASTTALKLATCLKASGAKFYGAFWCPHCNDQKAMFGDAVKELPYIECSTPDGRGQTPVCAAANITGYPTWVFADGSTLSGAIEPKELAAKTGCSIQ